LGGPDISPLCMGPSVDTIRSLGVNARLKSRGPSSRIGYIPPVRRVAKHRVIKNRER